MLTVGCLMFTWMRLRIIWPSIGKTDTTMYMSLIRSLPETSLTFLSLIELTIISLAPSMLSIPLHSLVFRLPFPTTQLVTTLWKRSDSGTQLNKLLHRTTTSCRKSVGRLKVKLKQFQYMCLSINSIYKLVKVIWQICKRDFGRLKDTHECLTIFLTILTCSWSKS